MLMLMLFSGTSSSLLLTSRVAFPHPTTRVGAALAMSAANSTASDETAGFKRAGSELRIDEDRQGLGVAALVGAAALVPLLAFGVATTLGMSAGSMDNGGIGSPLSREEVKMMLQREEEASKRGGADADEAERPLTFEEAAEEQALVDILRGGINRAR